MTEAPMTKAAMNDQPAPAQDPKAQAGRTWPYALGFCAIVAAITLAGATSPLGERVVGILVASLNWLYGLGAVISLLGLLFAWLSGDRTGK